MPEALMTRIDGCGECKYHKKPIVMMEKNNSVGIFILFECCGKLIETVVVGIGELRSKIRMK